MRKIKEILFSENGMKVVNTLFFLAMFFYMSGLLFVAYIVWICYLVFCIRNTESRGSKVVYSVFVGLAVVMCLLLMVLPEILKQVGLQQTG